MHTIHAMNGMIGMTTMTPSTTSSQRTRNMISRILQSGRIVVLPVVVLGSREAVAVAEGEAEEEW